MILATTIMVVFSVLSNLLLKLDTRSFAQGQGIRRVGVAIGPRRGEAQYRAAPMARIAGIAHHVTQRGSQPSGFPSATTMSLSIATGSPSRAASSPPGAVPNRKWRPPSCNKVFERVPPQ